MHFFMRRKKVNLESFHTFLWHSPIVGMYCTLYSITQESLSHMLGSAVKERKVQNVHICVINMFLTRYVISVEGEI